MSPNSLRPPTVMLTSTQSGVSAAAPLARLNLMLALICGILGRLRGNSLGGSSRRNRNGLSVDPLSRAYSCKQTCFVVEGINEI